MWRYFRGWMKTFIQCLCKTKCQRITKVSQVHSFVALIYFSELPGLAKTGPKRRQRGSRLAAKSEKCCYKRQATKQEQNNIQTRNNMRILRNNACKNDRTGKHRKHKCKTDEPTKSERRWTNETQVSTEKEGEKNRRRKEVILTTVHQIALWYKCWGPAELLALTKI